MANILGTSHSFVLVDAVNRILLTIVANSSNPNDHIPIPSPDSLTPLGSERSIAFQRRAAPPFSVSGAVAGGPLSPISPMSPIPGSGAILRNPLPLADGKFNGILSNDCGNFILVSRSKKFSVSHLASQLIDAVMRS